MVETAVPIDQQTQQLVEPISQELRALFGDNVSSYQDIDWNEKSRTFLNHLRGQGYMISEGDSSKL